MNWDQEVSSNALAVEGIEFPKRGRTRRKRVETSFLIVLYIGFQQKVSPKLKVDHPTSKDPA